MVNIQPSYPFSLCGDWGPGLWWSGRGEKGKEGGGGGNVAERSGWWASVGKSITGQSGNRLQYTPLEAWV